MTGYFFSTPGELILKDISRYINRKEGKEKFAWNPLWVWLFHCLNTVHLYHFCLSNIWHTGVLTTQFSSCERVLLPHQDAKVSTGRAYKTERVYGEYMEKGNKEYCIWRFQWTCSFSSTCAQCSIRYMFRQEWKLMWSSTVLEYQHIVWFAILFCAPCL